MMRQEKVASRRIHDRTATAPPVLMRSARLLRSVCRVVALFVVGSPARAIIRKRVLVSEDIVACRRARARTPTENHACYAYVKSESSSFSQ